LSDINNLYECVVLATQEEYKNFSFNNYPSFFTRKRKKLQKEEQQLKICKITQNSPITITIIVLKIVAPFFLEILRYYLNRRLQKSNEINKVEQAIEQRGTVAKKVYGSLTNNLGNNYYNCNITFVNK
jgi:hypothetical protein